MRIIRPNQLHYRFCDIPPNVEAALQALVDEFYVDMQDIDKQLDDFLANGVPGILAIEQNTADLIQELLRGAPVPELASLQAIQDNLKLGNPKLDENDPSLVSLDERKLGVVGLLLIYGKMFALGSGDAFEVFRQIWYAAQGNYKAFLALGDAIADTVDGDFTILQYAPDYQGMPFINVPWKELDTKIAYKKISRYRQPLFWTNSIDASSANYNRLKDIGYSDLQVSKMFAGEQPQNEETALEGIFDSSLVAMNRLAALLSLPFTNEKRQPKWNNEYDRFKEAVSFYLQYRKDTALNSYIFNSDTWERMKAVFKERDLKEIFENRLEVKDVVVPTDDTTIGNLLLAASKIPVGSSAMHSYLISLPGKRDTFVYEQRLISVGTSILKEMLKDKNASTGPLKTMLEELKGEGVSEADISVPDKLTIEQYKIIVKNPNQSPGKISDGVNKSVKLSPNPQITNDALGTIITGEEYSTKKHKAPTATEGMPTQESPMTVLFRRIKWEDNFVSCKKKSVQESNVPSTTETADKFTKFGPALNQNIQTKPGGSADPKDLYGQDGKALLKNPKNLGGSQGKPDLSNLPTRGRDRRTVLSSPKANPTTITQKFTYDCFPTFQNGFLDQLTTLQGQVSQQIIVACEALKRALFMIQNIIDNLIAKAQVVLNQVLGILERLLTLNLNLGGAAGLDTGIIKCSWSIDFSIKLDLFGVLLRYLNEFFDKIFGPIRLGLRAIQDLITKAICVPIRLLEMFLGGVNSLLGLIGCSLKDIKLPQAILDLLKALLFTFDLRTLVLRQGYDAYFEMSVDPKSGARPFQGLTQFAQLCQSVTMTDAVNAIEDATLFKTVAAPGFLAGELSKKADDLAFDTSIKAVGFI